MDCRYNSPWPQWGRSLSLLKNSETLIRLLFIKNIQAMLILFFAFLVAPVNPHLSKYIFTLKMALYFTIKKNRKCVSRQYYLATFLNLV